MTCVCCFGREAEAEGRTSIRTMAGVFVSKARVDRFVAYSVGGIALTFGFGALGMHGFFIDRYMNAVRRYRDGRIYPLEPELVKVANQVLKEVKMARRKKLDVRFFPVTGDDVFHAGSVEMTWGGIVGIPYNFNYKSASDINTQEVSVLNNQVVKWDSKAGKKLLDSCVLSEKAKKFAIAREIFYVEGYQVHVLVTNIFLTSLLTYSISGAVLKYRNIYAKPLPVRLVCYALGTLIALTNFYLLNDGIQIYYDRKADSKAVGTNDEYFEGAIEYYEKLLQRNKALRKLLGKSGPGFYTAEGDSNHWFRITSMPLTARIAAIQAIKNNDALE